MSLHTRVLFLGDDVATVTLALAELSQSGVAVEHRVVATAEELRDALPERWSAVISSPRMDHLDVNDALRMIRAHDEKIPIIILSSNGDATAAAELIRAGANDCVRTSDVGRLGAAVAHQMKDARLRGEARRLATALEESDRQYRLTFENAPIGIVHADTSGRIILANLRFCALIGYTLSEVIGRHFNVFSHLEDASRARDVFQEVVAGTRTTARFERRYIHQDGTTVWAAISLSSVVQGGALIYILGFVEDITERKRSEEELRVSEERYRSVVEGSSEIIFTTDVAGRFLTLNAAFDRITGLKRSQWIGRDSSEITSMVDGAHTTSFLHRVISEQIPLSAELRIAGREGDVLVDIAAAPKIENGRATAVFGYARDITEARRAEREHTRMARNLELLLDSTIEGILAVDTKERCTLINRAAAALLARPVEAFIGQPMHDLLNEVGTPCSIDDVLRTGVPCTVTTDKFRRGDGKSFPVEFSAAPILEQGSIIGVVVTFTDVTDRRKLEAQLEQAGRLASLGRLAATMTHEFNNVLMGISPFIEVIRRGPSPEKMSTALDHMGAAIRRGKHITGEVLRFTQPAEPVISPIAVEPWLRGIELEARTILMPTNHTIATAIEDSSLTVRGDSNQLHQVFTNLIGNARDAMPDGGTIVIRLRRERADARFPYGVLKRPECFAHFVVEDSGCGMSAETRRHIFEPLFTTKKSGTGIGLAVTHQVMQRHGGAIFVETELGVGTAFHLFIPLLERKLLP